MYMQTPRGRRPFAHEKEISREDRFFIYLFLVVTGRGVFRRSITIRRMYVIN